MKLIYIAGAYTNGDVAENVRRACLVGDALLDKGYIPFVPHLTHFWHYLSPKAWEVWLKIDLEILTRCDAVLRINGESRGADIEVKHAKEWGKAIYYSIEEIPK